MRIQRGYRCKEGMRQGYGVGGSYFLSLKINANQKLRIFSDSHSLI